MRPRWTTAAVLAAACVALPLRAHGQSPTPSPAVTPAAPRQPRFVLGLGIGWLGGHALGTRDATLAGNAGPSGDPVVLFRTSSRYDGAMALGTRVGVPIGRRVTVEAAFGFARPSLRTEITDDTEDAPDVVAGEEIAQYALEGSLAVSLPRLAFSTGRAVPFVTGGAGYLRQLADDRRVVEEAVTWHAGGGVRWRLAAPRTGVVREYGVRLDVRLNARSGGIDIEERVRLWPSADAMVVVGF